MKVWRTEPPTAGKTGPSHVQYIGMRGIALRMQLAAKGLLHEFAMRRVFRTRRASWTVRVQVVGVSV